MIPINEKPLCRKKALDVMVSRIKSGKPENFQEFIDVMYRNGFFNYLQKNDIKYFLSEESYIPTTTSVGVTIGIEIFADNSICVGIDPQDCFNKVGQCSIVACFPMKKREFKRFILLFNKLLITNTQFRKQWLKEANSYWCGESGQFGI